VIKIVFQGKILTLASAKRGGKGNKELDSLFAASWTRGHGEKLHQRRVKKKVTGVICRGRARKLIIPILLLIRSGEKGQTTRGRGPFEGSKK